MFTATERKIEQYQNGYVILPNEPRLQNSVFLSCKEGAIIGECSIIMLWIQIIE
jgi:hypothetical protein